MARRADSSMWQTAGRVDAVSPLAAAGSGDRGRKPFDEALRHRAWHAAGSFLGA
jgi:hypothetical protein